MDIDVPATWIAFGFVAQLFFTARFLVQWLASERAGASVVPVSFWYLSLLGSGMLLAYALRRRDPVFVLGQATGFAIYLRNLHLIRGGSPLRRGSPESGAAERATGPGGAERA